MVEHCEDGERQPLVTLPRQIHLSELGKYVGTRYFHMRLCIIGFVVTLVPAMAVGPVPYILKDVERQFEVSHAQSSWLASGVIFGSIGGVYFSGYFGDRFGRLITIYICTAATALLSLGHFAVGSFTQLVVLRVLLGIPYGGLITIVSPYVMEFAADSARGWLSVVPSLAWPFAAVAAIVLVSRFEQLETVDQEWRFVLSAVSIIAAAALVCLHRAPESPRWLLVMNRNEDAMNIMSDIFASSAVIGTAPVGEAPTVETPEKDKAIQETESSLRSVFLHRIPELFETEELRCKTAMASMICVTTTAVSDACWAWGPVLLSRASGQEKVPLWIFAVTETAGMVGTCIAMATSDWLGRRVLLIGSWMTIVLFFLILAAGPGAALANLCWITMGGFIGINWAVINVYFGEVFPTQIRCTGASFSMLLGRVAGGAAPILLGWVLDTSVTLCLLTLAATFAVSSLVAFVYMEETARTAIA